MGGLVSNVSSSERSSPSLQSKTAPSYCLSLTVLSSSQSIIPFTHVLMLCVPSPECQLHQGQAYLSVLFTAVSPAPRTVPGTL